MSRSENVTLPPLQRTYVTVDLRTSNLMVMAVNCGDDDGDDEDEDGEKEEDCCSVGGGGGGGGGVNINQYFPCQILFPTLLYARPKFMRTEWVSPQFRSSLGPIRDLKVPCSVASLWAGV